MTKLRKIASIEKLSADVLEALQEKYPEGWEGEMRKITKSNNEFFYAIELDFEDISYLVKVPFEIDSTDYWEKDDDLPDIDTTIDKKSIELELEEDAGEDDDDIDEKDNDEEEDEEEDDDDD